MELNNKKSNKTIVLIGAAMFSMFFGAGNMIFPPFLGFSGGKQWVLGFIGYFITDIGLVILTLLALVRKKGQEELLNPLGNIIAAILIFMIIMCLGPIISIPRTAATTYELSVVPILGEQKFAWFYILYFTLVLVMCIKKSAVIDIIGKILTPLLFAGLLLLIIIGIINPIGDISIASRTESVFADGIEAGYQSMDVLGAIVFGALIISSAQTMGYINNKHRFRVILYSGFIAGFGLFVVYLGLTYLGATSCTIHNMHVTRTELLTEIVNRLLPGKIGLILFGIVAGLACLSTAVALTGSAADYLSRLTKEKINYKVFVIIICIAGVLISTIGVDMLVRLASPLLSVIYPPILTTVILSFIDKKIGIFSYRFTGYTALLFGLYDAVSSFGLRLYFIDALPLQSIGLGWILPSILAFITGFLLDKNYKKRTCS